jgi:hypothetical protein
MVAMFMGNKTGFDMLWDNVGVLESTADLTRAQPGINKYRSGSCCDHHGVAGTAAGEYVKLHWKPLSYVGTPPTRLTSL